MQRQKAQTKPNLVFHRQQQTTKQMTTLQTIASTILLLNAFWDLVTGIAIVVYASTGWLESVANAHLLLWIRLEEPAADKLLQQLLTVLLLQWAWTRYFDASNQDGKFVDGAVTYLLEGWLMLLGLKSDIVEPLRGSVVFGLCLSCCVLMLAAEVEPSFSQHRTLLPLMK